jgi:toxin-antitoxin system PIN domain toxin
VIAIDTNILVCAQRTDLPLYSAAARCLADLNRAGIPWALPWHCVHEFFSVVTNRKLWNDPTPPVRAVDQIESWLESPLVVMIGEGPSYGVVLRQVLTESGVTGAKVHDARVVAVCREHGIDTIWSADRDFARFPGLRVVNPLLR